eukprot:370061-Rhodomonas_salina.1
MLSGREGFCWRRRTEGPGAGVCEVHSAAAVHTHRPSDCTLESSVRAARRAAKSNARNNKLTMGTRQRVHRIWLL